MIRSLFVVGLVLGIGAFAGLTAVSQPVPTVVEFSRTIEAGMWTIEVSGQVSFDPAERSVSGTVMVKVTDPDGNVVIEKTIVFASAGGAAPIVEDIPISQALVVLHLEMDPFARSVTLTIEELPGSGMRRFA